MSALPIWTCSTSSSAVSVFGFVPGQEKTSVPDVLVLIPVDLQGQLLSHVTAFGLVEGLVAALFWRPFS
jgi:hypothetical protein